MGKEEKTIKQTTEKKCPYCGSENVFGLRTEHSNQLVGCGCGAARQYECLECGEQFSYNPC